MPKLPVSQRAHGLPCGAMGSHIAVGGGIAVTNIQIASCTTTVAIYKAGRMQGSLSSAVGAMDIDSFQNVHLLLSACVRSLLAALPQLGWTAPFRIFYVPDKPAGVEALESLQRHNADAIIFIHGLTGQLLENRHRYDCRHGIVIYRQKKAGAVGTMLAVDEKTVPPITAGCL